MATEMAEHVLAAADNTDNIVSACQSFPTVEEFLKSSEVRILLHAAKVSEPEKHLQYNFDIDGILVELTAVTVIKKGISYLFLPEKQRQVKDHFFLYRKHVDLSSQVKGSRLCITVVEW